MDKRFLDYIEEHRLLADGDRVLACVSGGVDSMTLLHLLYRHFGEGRVIVAHCNFMLRGGQSDAETAMVIRTAESLNVEYEVKHFDTKAICAQSGESIQMAARRVRYEWFEEVASKHNCTKIAIAHHSDDSTETFFINLLRGTGLRGLTGIGRSRERIIRPLLFASRSDIESYALKHAVEYMTDSSNHNQEYLRSRLRYDILPRFEGASSGFGSMMGSNIERLSAAQRFIDSQIGRITEELTTTKDKDTIINLSELQRFEQWNFILFEMLRPYNFKGEIIGDIINAELSGKRFLSPSHQATLDRGSLIITARISESVEEEVIEIDDPRVEWIDPCSLSTLECPNNVALLSGDALQFPLTIRRWRHGDWFMPLGMQSHKKVSDYLIDAKVSLVDKERQGVLISGSDTIVWLIGKRIDNRYKLTEATVKAVRITL